MKVRWNYENAILNLPAAAAEHVRDATEQDLRVLLVLASAGEDDGTETLAERAGVTETEWESALSFWRGAGVIGADRETRPGRAKKTEKREKEAADVPSVSALAYSGEDVERLCTEKPELADTIAMAQGILEKGSFTPAEVSIFAYLSDHLRLDCEYILLLVSHCKEIGKKSLSYIEKTAISLYDDGIDTVERLEAYFKREDEKRSTEYAIRKLYGIGDRALTAKEKEILAGWMKEGYSLDLITEGYETMMRSKNVTRPSFAYENKILESWKSQGITTAEAAREKSAAGKTGSGAPSFDLDEFFNLAVERAKKRE